MALFDFTELGPYHPLRNRIRTVSILLRSTPELHKPALLPVLRAGTLCASRTVLAPTTLLIRSGLFGPNTLSLTGLIYPEKPMSYALWIAPSATYCEFRTSFKVLGT
ncbi:hypothetical protein N7478_012955 [Penicillium angulare]|uniref:uncharacterized protein n=1 Tax=Penicillium angulare TaxID=116970 RepID=UPI00254187F2|nr:uncharacterized protein N7478_012955 [Penicillium angulare]KAJ5256851.1 hypothetical protein N7478_012955 [Penicillium angulare]